MPHNNKFKRNKSVVFTLIFFSFLLFACPQKTQAAVWPGIDPAISSMLTKIYDMVQAMARTAAKQAAVQMLNGQVNTMMAGNGKNGAAFITNWQDYLITQPQTATTTYMNSYIAGMTGGRGSSSSYSSEGFSGTGSYATSLVQSAKSMLAQQNQIPKMTYEGDPSQMFASGNFDNLALKFSGVNPKIAFNMVTQDTYQKKLAQQQLINQTKAISYQGFNGTSSSNGTITYPGSLAKDLVANIQNIPNNTIASATSVPEVIASVASSMINNLFRNGFDSIQKSVQNQDNSQNKLNAGTTANTAQNGPTSTWKNPDTNSTFNPSTASSTSTWVDPDKK